jgi:hypothetical protein
VRPTKVEGSRLAASTVRAGRNIGISGCKKNGGNRLYPGTIAVHAVRQGRETIGTSVLPLLLQFRLFRFSFLQDGVKAEGAYQAFLTL